TLYSASSQCRPSAWPRRPCGSTTEIETEEEDENIYVRNRAPVRRRERARRHRADFEELCVYAVGPEGLGLDARDGANQLDGVQRGRAVEDYDCRAADGDFGAARRHQ